MRTAARFISSRGRDAGIGTWLAETVVVLDRYGGRSLRQSWCRIGTPDALEPSLGARSAPSMAPHGRAYRSGTTTVNRAPSFHHACGVESVSSDAMRPRKTCRYDTLRRRGGDAPEAGVDVVGAGP